MVRLATNEFFRFCRKYFGNETGHTIPQISCACLYLCLNNMRTSIGSFWPFFNWFHGLSRLLIGGPPRSENLDGSPNHQPWVIRWANQDFAFSAALVNSELELEFNSKFNLSWNLWNWSCSWNCYSGVGVDILELTSPQSWQDLSV